MSFSIGDKVRARIIYDGELTFVIEKGIVSRPLFENGEKIVYAVVDENDVDLERFFFEDELERR